MRLKGKNIRIPLNTISVSYNDQGPDESPVIIFIHGFPFNKSMWDGQMKELKENNRVIAYDVRGHGDSFDGGKEDFSIELFVSDLIELMDALKIDKAMLCGLSMGGYIALRAFEKYPGRFDSLVLSDTNCIADTPQAKEKRMKAIENINENGVEKYVEDMIKNLFAPASFETKLSAISSVSEMMKKNPADSLCNTLLALAARKETCSKLTEIKVPVLIIVGNEDKITPPAAARLMHEKIENSRLCILKNAAHLANIESPDEFNEQLKMFVNYHAKKTLSHSN